MNRKLFLCSKQNEYVNSLTNIQQKQLTVFEKSIDFDDLIQCLLTDETLQILTLSIDQLDQQQIQTVLEHALFDSYLFRDFVLRASSRIEFSVDFIQLYLDSSFANYNVLYNQFDQLSMVQLSQIVLQEKIEIAPFISMYKLYCQVPSNIIQYLQNFEVQTKFEFVQLSYCLDLCFLQLSRKIELFPELELFLIQQINRQFNLQYLELIQFLLKKQFSTIKKEIVTEILLFFTNVIENDTKNENHLYFQFTEEYLKKCVKSVNKELHKVSFACLKIINQYYPLLEDEMNKFEEYL